MEKNGINKKCKICDKEFYVPKCNMNKICCSIECRNKNPEFKRNIKKAVQKMVSLPNYVNPMKGKKRPDVSEYNKNRISPLLGRKRPRQEIDKISRTKKLYKIMNWYKNRYGKNNNNYKGNDNNGYGYEFNKELKWGIKSRQKFKCKVCKIHADLLPQGLYVHHIDLNKKNNKPSNLVALCNYCHRHAHNRYNYWKKYFTREYSVKKIYLTWTDINDLCHDVYEFLKDKNVSGMVPVVRGGCIPATIIANALNCELKSIPTNDNDVIIDDIVDFGKTLIEIKKYLPNNLFVSLHLNKINFNNEEDIKPDYYAKDVIEYIVYPWEYSSKLMEGLNKEQTGKNKNGKIAE